MQYPYLVLLMGLIGLSSFANDNSQLCLPLLESLIENTQAARGESSKQSILRGVQTKEWGIGSGKLKVLYKDGTITLEGTKEPITLVGKLTPAQLERFKLFTEKQSDRFDLKFNPKSNRSALRDGVNYARLHEAFYGQNPNPLEAAIEIESLIKRSARMNVHLKTKIRNSETSEKFLENVGTFAENLDALSKLHREGRLEEAVRDYQVERQQEQGAQALDRIVGIEPTINLAQVIQNTESKKEMLNPDAVELEIDFAHDDPIKLNIERKGSGKLELTPRGRVGFSIKNLKQLVEWLQGRGLDGKSYDWRTYELIESDPF